MEPGRLRTLLVADGREARWRGLRWTASVLVSGLSMIVLASVLSAVEVVVPIELPWLVGALTVLSVGPPALFAYRHEGLLLCLALGSALPVALYVVPAASPAMAPDESVRWGLRAGLAFGLPAGAVGFLLGVGARTFEP